MSGALRVGIVGAHRGGGHLAAIRASAGRAMLAGVYDPLPQATEAFLAENPDARAYGRFEDAVEDCDLLVLASPQHYHAPQAALALGACVHVLSEVPAAVSLDQVNQLLAAARNSSAKYMIAENYCYTRENLVVSAMAKSGLLGKLYYGEAEYTHDMKWAQRHADGSPTWRSFWQMGINAVTYPTHSLGPILQWLDDRIVSLSCTGSGRWTSDEFEIEDVMTIACRTRKGGLIRMRLDLVSNRPDVWNYYQIQGTEGAYESGRGFGDRPRIYLHGRSAPDTWEDLDGFRDHLPARYANPLEGAGHWGSDAWPLMDLLDVIDDRIPCPLGIYEALDMTLPGIVSGASVAANGAWVPVPDPRTLTAGIGVNPGREAPLV